MRVELVFAGAAAPRFELMAETDAEKAILGFLAEDNLWRWMRDPVFTYRPSQVEKLSFVAVPSPTESA